ncbi:MAG: response regulator [Sedimentisphaerales bacterium]|nr:response regulator [Sedimentisphaerales bacterium]
MSNRQISHQILLDLVIISILSAGVFIIAGYFDLFAYLQVVSQEYQEGMTGKIFLVLIILVIGLSYFAWRRWRETIHEIQYRDQIESQLKTSNQALKKASRAKSQYLANLSHEIRTPLHAIIGYADAITVRAPDTETLKYAMIVTRESERLLALLNDILDHTIIEEGKVTLYPTPTALHRYLQETIDSCQLQADFKKIDLSLHIDPEVPETVLVDKIRLRQILVNLIQNAIKFTAHGSVTVRVFVEDRHNDVIEVRFEVEDTGIGIPEDKQATIFEAFKQVDNGLNRSYGGVGLGTAIVYNLVKLMQGEIGLESRPGNGSIFWIILPLSVAKTSEIIQSQADIPNDSKAKHVDYKARILVAEDYPTNQDIIRIHLSEEGHDLVIVDNGRQAVEAGTREPFDLIILDIQMPEINGFEAAKALRKKDSPNTSTPILGLSANADPQIMDLARQVGIQEMLTKPIRRTFFIQAINRWLSQHRKPSPSSQAKTQNIPLEPTQQDPPLNISAAVEELGSLEKMEPIVHRLLELAQEQIQIMEKAIRAQDSHLLYQESHALKGGASSIQAHPLARAATRLMELAQENNLNQADKALQDLIQEVHRLTEYVNHLSH